VVDVTTYLGRRKEGKRETGEKRKSGKERGRGDEKK